jgi:hypothetical protein
MEFDMKRATAMKTGHPPDAPSEHAEPAQSVRVPIWFTVAQARKVADLKRLEHVFVEERGQICGFASRAVLAQAPADDLVGRWATRALPPAAPLVEHDSSASDQLIR